MISSILLVVFSFLAGYFICNMRSIDTRLAKELANGRIVRISIDDKGVQYKYNEDTGKLESTAFEAVLQEIKK